jgi:outer membrane protein assembly factor BamA
LQLQGEWRFNLTNQDTWGVGPMQNTDKIDLLDFNLARFYETAYLQVVKGFYVGLGFNCDYFFSIVDHNARAGKPSMMQDYYGGRNVTQERSIGLSLGLMFDSRDNQINPKKGMYANASFRVSPKAFGSDDTWEQFWGEFRAYPRLGGENILAIWVWTWFTFGNVPYLSLPAIGWDTFNRSGRGFTQGRIRSNDMIYMEVEYRIKLMKNDLIGMVVFVNGTAASDPGTNSFTTVSPAGGAGLRVKLNRISETNLAIDAAIGDRLSYGLFMAVQEAF